MLPERRHESRAKKPAIAKKIGIRNTWISNNGTFSKGLVLGSRYGQAAIRRVEYEQDAWNQMPSSIMHARKLSRASYLLRMAEAIFVVTARSRSDRRADLSGRAMPTR
jgi:hypothetical protein